MLRIRQLGADGESTVREVEVHGDSVTVGRAADNDLRVDLPTVSSRHLRVLWGLVIADSGSLNGSFVDGQRVRGVAVLPPRATVELGGSGTRLTIEYVDAEPPVEGATAADGRGSGTAAAGRTRDGGTLAGGTLVGPEDAPPADRPRTTNPAGEIADLRARLARAERALEQERARRNDRFAEVARGAVEVVAEQLSERALGERSPLPDRARPLEREAELWRRARAALAAIDPERIAARVEDRARPRAGAPSER